MGSLLPARLAKKLTLLLVDDPSQQQSQRPLRFLLLRGLATIPPLQASMANRQSYAARSRESSPWPRPAGIVEDSPEFSAYMSVKSTCEFPI